MPEISRVGVLGCGLMGSGIAQAAAAAGLPDRRARRRGRPARHGARRPSGSRSTSWSRRASSTPPPATARWTVSPSPPTWPPWRTAISSSRPSPRTSRSRTSSGARSTPRAPAGTIFASNTSSLSIGDMAAATGRPGPLRRPPLLQSRAAHAAGRGGAGGGHLAARRSSARWHSPGASARSRSPPATARASWSTGCSCPTCSTPSGRWSRASASAADIDRGMQLGCGHPMGPLTLLDFVGLDTVASASPRSCSTSTGRPASPRRRCCGGWWRPVCMAGNRAGGFMIIRPIRPTPIDLGL